LKKELDVLSKSLTTAQKQLEAETIMRVDLENRIQSLKEDLLFKTQVHETVCACHIEICSNKSTI